MAVRATSFDRTMMERCLRLAERGAGSTSPNPLVGAVLTKGHRIIATGRHRRYGGPHAEVECLRAAGIRARGGTLYVNLEPCCHQGKTPPCTGMIIGAGIRRVVVGMRDPNPLVAGRGITALRRAGISVTVGVLGHDAEELNRMFSRHIQLRRPYVHVKIARSLDGKIAAGGGKPRWISSPESRRVVHSWRSWHDAVLVGAGTVRTDDPRLDVREADGRNPDVVILDGSLSISPAARVFRDTSSRRVFVCTTRRAASRKDRRVRELSLAGAAVLVFPSATTRISLRGLLRTLYGHLIGSVLVEGGREVFTQFIEAGLVDELSLFVAPLLIPAGIAELDVASKRKRVAATVSRGDVRAWKVGPDVLVNARFPIASRSPAGRPRPCSQASYKK